MNEKSFKTMPHIIIVGGGFSGTILSKLLIEKSINPIKISIFEKNDEVSTGIAYSTTNPQHLLNVPVEKIGALYDNPYHFYEWLQESENLWRKLDQSFENIKIEFQEFFPRMIFGAYLKDLWKKTLQLAQDKNCVIEIMQDEVLNIENLEDGFIVTTNNFKIVGDFAILATGVPGNKDFNLKVINENYIHNIWAKNLNLIKPNSKVAIIGTALTTIDAIIMLKDIKNLQFTAISKHGKWPEFHIKNLEVYPPFIDKNHLPTNALSFFFSSKKEVKKALKKGINWRSVLDSLRPLTVNIWQNFNLDEKKKLLKLISSVWNTHRHRRPKIDAKAIEDTTLIAGSVISLEKADSQIKIVYTNSLNEKKEMVGDYVINCSGPELNILKNKTLLFKNLVNSGLIVQHPLKLGIEAEKNCKVIGKNNGNLFAIGLLLTGCRFETVAVPELRNQCLIVAEEILKSIIYKGAKKYNV